MLVATLATNAASSLAFLHKCGGNVFDRQDCRAIDMRLDELSRSVFGRKCQLQEILTSAKTQTQDYHPDRSHFLKTAGLGDRVYLWRVTMSYRD